MLEVTERDIAALNDEDLRSLVALLCEATLRLLGLPSSAVTAGGDQNAADGGIDVRVDLPAGTAIVGFVPRPATGFQVKKPDMRAAALKAEMRHGGELRPVIRDLITREGAYVIVSSTASVSDSKLNERRAAMAAAIADAPGAERLKLDFYDRKRLATWVGDHPGLTLWVRAKAGCPIQGWQSYGAWAYSPSGVDDDYLLDDEVRLHDVRNVQDQEISAAGGLERLRATLCEPGKSVRLVGLSGVGKTRFVQALFDRRVGQGALDPAQAMYANLGDGPEPLPVAVATSMIARRSRAVLIIDNCPPDLHRRLTDLCRAAGSTVSVLTVEYDITDDQPEGSEVFRLEGASADLVDRLVQLRFPAVSQVDARSIADFSGGNARIALALAHTLGENETLAGVSDADLFARLFHQRNAPDQSLLATAAACSLVYSFDGEDLTGDEAELPRLAALAGRPVGEVYRQIAELRRRDLVQSRGRWRAVLPQAIAHHMAASALQGIPAEEVEAQLVTGAPDRLLRSFSRRLGHLPESAAAVRIAECWLTPPGMLADPTILNELGQTVFTNIAPLAPEAALAALERAAAGSNDDRLFSGETWPRRTLVRLLRALAFDADLFERSARLLVRAALAEEAGAKSDGAGDAFASLFHLYLSGTHASAEQRTRMAEALLRAGEERRQGLGLRALEAALEAGHFSSAYGFEFGARSRDHGYQPNTYAEQLAWYSSFAKLAHALGRSDLPVAARVRSLLASCFRELWSRAGAHDDLEDAARSFSADRCWDEGWIAVRQTIRWDADEMIPEARDRLMMLEGLLAPKDLAAKVRARVFSRRAYLTDIGDEEMTTESIGRARAALEELGREVGRDCDLLRRLMPDLTRSENDTVWDFARGLALSVTEPEAVWEVLSDEFAHTPEAEISVAGLRGFLNGLWDRCPVRVAAMLDDAVEREGLAQLFPHLQFAAGLDRNGVARLHRSLALGTAPLWTYRNLRFCQTVDGVSSNDLQQLLEAIAAKLDGVAVAVDVLAMCFHMNRGRGQHDPALIAAGRSLLRAWTPGAARQHRDHDLVTLIEVCAAGPEGRDVAERLCREVQTAFTDSRGCSYACGEVTSALFRTQPEVALTVFLGDGGTARQRYPGRHVLEDLAEFRRNPLDEIPPEVVLAWCDSVPAVNYALAAAAIRYEQVPDGAGSLGWSDLALELLRRAPDRRAVLERFVARFGPTSWSGSRAAIIARRSKLLGTFEGDSDERVAAFARRERERLARETEQERRAEAERDRERDERFE